MFKLYYLLSSLFITLALARRPCIDTTDLPEWSKRNLNTIQRIYNLTIYPANAQIVATGASAVPAGLFNEDATGRISPLGNFSKFTDSIEYFFGLAPTPQTSAGVGFYAADIVAYTSGCPDVATSVVYLRSGQVSENGTLDRTKPTTTLSQVAFWKFDDAGAVLFYQAWIPELQKWVETATGLNYSNSVLQTAAENVLCSQIQDHCTGQDQQYNDTTSCANILGSKPFGSFDEAWGDNVVCRIIHVLLTHVRPDCVDVNYTVDYFNDAALFGSSNKFTCNENPYTNDGHQWSLRDLLT
ncbi:Secreted protein [Teratosphaeria destructans]|uniref:Secreted protein n=1 Tax=Teratosphaeria destructans TaxID=418781 RepID=A0A9W7W1H1_9PEZI|nr:Secreted protein [Teratosphaeria destructans]